MNLNRETGLKTVASDMPEGGVCYGCGGAGRLYTPAKALDEALADLDKCLSELVIDGTRLGEELLKRMEVGKQWRIRPIKCRLEKKRDEYRSMLGAMNKLQTLKESGERITMKKVKGIYPYTRIHEQR